METKYVCSTSNPMTSKTEDFPPSSIHINVSKACIDMTSVIKTSGGNLEK